ncbi:UNKNOWN [Stylonychia lemnae]|uniref:Uncharacterized protein n=1 Tax=Stylonychia lemnae TaxID=5949 RepID=A0A078B415_STYLE|nr:UNKNOWN [Stylonychia lemnae]|eukprot:CDW89280.1 UNKNOWN [Stylonychia lemnae]
MEAGQKEFKPLEYKRSVVFAKNLTQYFDHQTKNSKKSQVLIEDQLSYDLIVARTTMKVYQEQEIQKIIGPQNLRVKARQACFKCAVLYQVGQQELVIYHFQQALTQARSYSLYFQCSIQEIAYNITKKRGLVIFITSIQFLTYCLFPCAHLTTAASGTASLVKTYYDNFDKYQSEIIIGICMFYCLIIFFFIQFVWKLAESEVKALPVFQKSSQDYGELMMPIIAYSFQFELSLIPVQCYLKLSDQNGLKGYKASIISLTAATFYYTLILIFCQLCILIDELLRSSLTNHVEKLNSYKQSTIQMEHDISNILDNRCNDEISSDQLKKSRTRFITSIEITDDQCKSFMVGLKEKKYWMAYMDMKKKHRLILGFILFLVNAIILCVNVEVKAIVNLLGSTTIPLLIYVFPGYLYHEYHKQDSSLILMMSMNRFHYKFSQIFSILGGLLILVYSTSLIYNTSDETQKSV